MPRGRRALTRPLGQRRYRRLFVIATEGSRTEPDYFRLFMDDVAVHVVCIPARSGSSPDRVLRRLRERLATESLRREDEAWIVVDRDQWTDDQLRSLHDWSCEKDNYGLAVSNPMFELWLLFHFEDGNGLASAHDCLARLKRYLPEYRKGHLEIHRLAAGVSAAAERGRRRDTPPCADWPRSYGSTVYRLITRLRSL